MAMPGNGPYPISGGGTANGGNPTFASVTISSGATNIASAHGATGPSVFTVTGTAIADGTYIYSPTLDRWNPTNGTALANSVQIYVADLGWMIYSPSLSSAIKGNWGEDGYYQPLTDPDLEWSDTGLWVSHGGTLPPVFTVPSGELVATLTDATNIATAATAGMVTNGAPPAFSALLIGTGSTITNNSIVIGNGTTDGGQNSVAIGNYITDGVGAGSTYDHDVLIGTYVSANYGDTVGIGYLAAADGAGGVAIGSHAAVDSSAGIAVGQNAVAGGINDVALGIYAQTPSLGSNNIVLGAYAGANLGGNESSNIYIGSRGTSGESKTIRIGSTQTNTYIAGKIIGNGSGLTNSSGNLFVDLTITNGLATTNYVNAATNGLVTAAVTNGLATTNYVNTATNSVCQTNDSRALNLTNANNVFGGTWQFTTNNNLTITNTIVGWITNSTGFMIPICHQ